MGQTARGDRTRAALVDAALALFGERGVDETSVDEIAAAATVAKGTFYVHFERKQDVLLEVAAQMLGSLAEVRWAGTAEAVLQRVGDQLCERLENLPRPVAGRMVREIVGNRDAWVRVLGPRPTLAALLRPAIERGRADGVLRDDQSARRLAQALTILWLDNVIGWAERPAARPLRRDVHLATALFLHGARAR